MSDHNVKELTIEPMVTNIPMNKMLQKCGFKNLDRSMYKGITTKEFESFKYLVDLLSLS